MAFSDEKFFRTRNSCMDTQGGSVRNLCVCYLIGQMVSNLGDIDPLGNNTGSLMGSWLT